MKPLFLSEAHLDQLATQLPTPFYLYDEASILTRIESLQKAFSWNEGYREYFAIKANPNPHILQLFTSNACGLDCSSLAELVLAEKVGARENFIMLSSNNTPAEEFIKANELGSIINFDDITHIAYFNQHVKPFPKVVSFRYNPGKPLRGMTHIMGDPYQAKYGLTHHQILQAYQQARQLGAETFGVHAFLSSNTMDETYFAELATLLFSLALEVFETHGIRLSFINLSGGIGIPYHPEQAPISIENVAKKVQKRYDSMIKETPLHPLSLYTELGRYLTAEAGILVTRAIHKKETYKNYIGVDACMSDLMRPAIYGAYHHITVNSRRDAPRDHLYDIVGSLCENNDKFAIDRPLPKIEPGDLLVIHDAGAHGHAMGFNYNGKMRPAEYLLQQDGSIRKIRRAETLEDYFATVIDFP